MGGGPRDVAEHFIELHSSRIDPRRRQQEQAPLAAQGLPAVGTEGRGRNYVPGEATGARGAGSPSVQTDAGNSNSSRRLVACHVDVSAARVTFLPCAATSSPSGTRHGQ